MRKTEWLIVTLIIAMGLSCLFLSASSFRELSLLQLGRSLGRTCLPMMAAVGIVGFVYWCIQRKRK
ncbi:MAG: hypothetical protein E7L01_20220 [Paenibacillus macerans]|uniref:hypothetical protein n=1 Tax=Paenibacillus TaxID=44249 RepID=UPI001B0180A5|nr:hypothetical protein [Paenibacillus macerans]MDU7475638.1 hypothetical protein [Paenibacillus macerans]MEC0135803.1 hypothetical protein [Paenibacillus macerans]MEC0330755.1 hypothetical protein [Paenibacillus macerans]GIP12403.1 hypothetical protein J1TS5_45730 [Paenibacillus macerans]